MEMKLNRMDVDLSVEEIAGIVSFLGYGCPSKSVWFIGIEEGLGEMTSMEALMNLKARAKFKSTMDLYKAHLSLQANGRRVDIEKEPPSTQVWQFMAKIMLAASGERDWRERESVKAYIRYYLGRSSGETFLTELSPLPARNDADQSWMAMFKAIDPALDQKLRRRKEELKRALKVSAPHLVVCYGFKRKREFAELLDVEWQEIYPSICASQDSNHVLLPFFGNGQMSHKVIETLLHCGLLKNLSERTPPKKLLSGYDSGFGAGG